MMGRRHNRFLAVLLTAALLLGVFGGVLHARSRELGGLLEPIRKKYGLPALAGAVIVDGETTAWGATGFRKDGNDVKVTSEDKFHIGSCTKAMTATIIAMLVERGKLQWDMKLGDAFSDMNDMHPAYRDVTLRHLLAHRAGLPGANQSWPKGKTFMDMHNLPGPPMEQRFAYAQMMLRQEPQAKPGTKFIYSNAGYAIAGVLAERTMNTPWETLMRRMLFAPLGMTTAGFGAMGTPGRIDQPWQHSFENGALRAIGPGRFSDNPPVIGPGGTVHCSMRDWAKFAAIHLNGPRRKNVLLRAKAFTALHKADFGGDYAAGWNITNRDWGHGRVLTHSGSNNQNFAVIWMAPKRNFAVLVASNQGKGDVAKACDETAWMLIKEFLLRQ